MTRRKIGVAIGLPEPHAAQLQGWRDRFGDPAASAIPPHVTLLPPTPLAGSKLPDVEEHLRRVAERENPFTIHLRGTGTFRPISPVVFVPLAAGISQCERLEARVRSGPLARELRFNYHPHVTVAHDVSDAQLDRAYRELAAYDATFVAWGFTMFEQGPDDVWRPQRDFPFGQALPGPHVADRLDRPLPETLTDPGVREAGQRVVREHGKPDLRGEAALRRTAGRPAVP